MSVIRLYRLALPKTERYYRATAVCMGYFNAMLTEFTTLIMHVTHQLGNATHPLPVL
jgi:hypothetical protein